MYVCIFCMFKLSRKRNSSSLMRLFVVHGCSFSLLLQFLLVSSSLLVRYVGSGALLASGMAGRKRFRMARY